jgi:DinB superfamily
MAGGGEPSATLRPEQERARAYLRANGTEAPRQRIRERVAAAFASLERVVEGVAEGEARARPMPGEWSVLEVVDHLVETHRASIGELRDLLDDRRPTGAPIPAGLQSTKPSGRSWGDLVKDLAQVEAEVLSILDAAPADRLGAARAPIIMVINVREADGRERPLHCVEEVDWKAYAIVFRLHVLDHLNQIRKTLGRSRPER